jgi:hypothetical protein
VVTRLYCDSFESISNSHTRFVSVTLYFIPIFNNIIYSTLLASQALEIFRLKFYTMHLYATYPAYSILLIITLTILG